MQRYAKYPLGFVAGLGIGGGALMIHPGLGVMLAGIALVCLLVLWD